MAMKKKPEPKRKFPPLAPNRPPPPPSIDDLELADLLDVPALQSLLDAFFALEHIGSGIVAPDGQTLVAAGRPDICTQFHRLHPETCKHCLAGDVVLSAGGEPGAFATHRCRNHLRESATPIVVGGRPMGSLFLGPFFYADEEPDPELFRARAKQYGFDEAEYLAALGRVPRLSRDQAGRTMEFCARLARHIAELGHRNLQAARMRAERKQAEEKLRQDDALLRLAGKTAAFGGWSVDLATHRAVWSDEVAAIHDMPSGSSPSVEEAISFYAPEGRDRIARAFGACAARGVPYDEELEIVSAQGRRRWVRTTGVPVRDEQGRIVRVQGSFQNITERKLREEEHAFASRLTALVGAPGDLHERLAELTRVLQEWSKCEAVGIRLRAGEDFPYYETRGFPPAFVRGESRLCACGPDGKILRDGEGNPVLECMCGNILCGRFDPSKPFFTARGSFWTNSTTGLLATSTAADRQARTRNRCNGEGYESVALIPLRLDDRTLGLLQFNDVRPGRFTPGMIAHLERIADALAGALARREAEERLRLHAQLLDSVRESVVATDAQGRIVYWSRGAKHLYGYSAKEVLGKPYRDFAGALAPPDEEAFRREILAKGSWRGEHLQRRRNGETVWTSTVVFPVKDGLDRHAGFVGIDLDINDRKQAELSLRRSEREFQNLVETIHDIVFSIGPDGRIAYVSPAVRAATGYDPAEIAGSLFTDWFDPRDVPALRAAWHEVLAGSSRPGEYRIRTKSGETRWVRTSSTRLMENGAAAGVHGVMTDITDRKLAEEATRQSELRYRTFIETTADLVFLKDESFRYLISNGANNAFLGKPEADVIGRTDFDLMPKEAAECCRASDREALAQGKPVTAEESVGDRTYQTVKFPVPLPDGRTGVGGTIRDITERKQAEAEIRRLSRFPSENPSPVLRVDRAGRILFANKAGAPILRFWQREVGGTVPADWLEKLAAVFAAGHDTEVEMDCAGRIFACILTPIPGEDYANLYGRDITERKRAEEALRESEALYRSILSASPDDITLTDLEGRILMVSPSALKMFGYERADQMLGRRVFEFIVPGDRDRAGADIARLHEGASSGPVGYRSEYSGLRADGVAFDIEVNGEFIRDAAGRPVRMILIVRDVTDRKRAAEAMRQSEEKFAKAFQTSPYAITLTRAADGQFIEINDAFTAITGFAREEALANSSIGLRLWARPDDRRHVVDDLRQGNPVIAREYAFRHKSGRPITGLFSAQILRLGGENCILSSINDISERKQAEEALLESERRHRDYLAHSPYGVFVADEQGRLIQVNSAAGRITGYSEHELLSMSVLDLHGDDGRKDAEQHFQTVLREGHASEELKYRTRSGESRWWLVSAVKISDTRFLGFCNDITDRKRAEDALRNSELEFRSLAEAMPQIVWATRPDGWNIYFNHQWVDYTGLTLEEGYGPGWITPFHPDDRGRASEAWKNATQNNGTYALECRLRRHDGIYRWWLIRGVPLRDAGGKILKWFGTCTDIEDIKQSEEALRASQQITEGIIDSIPMRVFWKDRELNYLGCNKAFARDAGFSEPRDLVGKDDRQMGWRAQAELYRADDRQVLKSGKPKLFIEEPQTTPDGKTLTLLTSKIPLRNAAGEITGVLGTYMDITELKQAEEKLRAVELRLRDIASNIPGVVYQLMVNRKGFFEVPFMSAGCETLFGRAPTGLDYAGLWFDRMPPDDLAALRKALAAAAKRMEPWEMEFRIALPDGAHKWLRGSANPRKLPTGGVLWNGVLLDITELKRSEQALRDRETFQNLLMDTIPSPVFYKDRQDRYLGVNKAFETLYGKPRNELVGKSVFDLAPPEMAAIYHAKDVELFEKPGTQVYEAPMRDANGDLHDVVFHKASIVDAQGAVTGLVGIILDITARKRAEEKMLRESALNKTIIDSIPGTFYMLDEAGNYVRWSAYQRDEIVGKPDDQVAGFPALATIHPDDRALIQARIANVLSTGAVEVVEGRVLMRGGPAFRWLLMTGRQMMIDGRPHLVGIGIDITERKRMEAEAARQLDELRRWHAVTLGREGRVAELKLEVNALAARLGQPPPYPGAAEAP